MRPLAEERRLRRAHAHLERPFILMTKELTLLGFFTSWSGRDSGVAVRSDTRVPITAAYPGKGR